MLPSVEVERGRQGRSEPQRGDQQRTGLDIPVITRTLEQWQAIIDANPFPAAAADGTKLHVVVLDGPVDKAMTAFDATSFAPEEVGFGDGVVYLSLPDGMGRSKLAVAVQRVGNAKAGTARNWRTVLALAELAAAVSGGPAEAADRRRLSHPLSTVGRTDFPDVSFSERSEQYMSAGGCERNGGVVARCGA